MFQFPLLGGVASGQSDHAPIGKGRESRELLSENNYKGVPFREDVHSLVCFLWRSCKPDLPGAAKMSEEEVDWGMPRVHFPRMNLKPRRSSEPMGLPAG